MSNPEIITVNSEALEATVRDLLPSQNGFGSELQASNIITPIIDLTPTAEGSILRTDLQTAWDFSASHTQVDGGSSTIISNTGFFRVQLNYTALSGGSSVEASITITDGSSTKTLWEVNDTTTGTVLSFNPTWNEIVYLAAGMSVIATETGNGVLNVTTRQIATVTGELVVPAQFVSE